MKTLLDSDAVAAMLLRLEALRPDSPRQWGKMDVAQMLAHVAVTLELSLGDIKPPRSLIGRLIGGFIKGKVDNDRTLQRNSPTDNSIRVTDAREFRVEQARVRGLLVRYAAGGRGAVTSHPHPFFGPLTPDEWGRLQHKHVHHHFEQFGA